MAMLHLQHQHAGGPRIKDIEATRAAYRVVNGKRSSGKPYRRRIDIVLGEEGKNDDEEWIELKSLAGPYQKGWFAPKLAGISKNDETTSGFNAKADRSYFRQFFHDMRMNGDFISDEYEDEIIFKGGSKNAKYQWYFQDYTTGSDSKPPTAADANTIKRLCNTPSDVRPLSDFYDNNLSDDPKAIKQACVRNLDRIAIRDTKSYFKDLLQNYADQLEIQDLIDVINELGIKD